MTISINDKYFIDYAWNELLKEVGIQNGLASFTLSSVLDGSFSSGLSTAGAITSSVASGSVAYSQLTGAKLVTNGPTATRYISDSGSAIAITGDVTLTGNISGVNAFFTQGIHSSIASPSFAMSIQTGARFSTNANTFSRYISDNGTSITFTGSVSMNSSLAITGAFTGATTGAFSGRVTSSVASGSVAYSQLTGARLVTNGGTDTRYISDDGTNIAFTGPVTIDSFKTLTTTGAAAAGTATLVAGAVTVNTTVVNASSMVLYSRALLGGTAGHISITSQINGSFTLTSASGTETSTVHWWVLNPKV